MPSQRQATTTAGPQALPVTWHTLIHCVPQAARAWPLRSSGTPAALPQHQQFLRRLTKIVLNPAGDKPQRTSRPAIHTPAIECQPSVHSYILGAEFWALRLACQWPLQSLFLKANNWWGHWFVPNNTLSILCMGPRWILPLILKVTTALQFLTQNTKG